MLHQKGYSDSEPIGLAADLEGNIHVFYRGSFTVLGTDIRYYYARINARDLQPAAQDSSSPAMSQSAEIRLREVMGIPLKGLVTAPTDYIPQNFALNPETGIALIGMRFLIQGDKYTTSFETPQRLLNITSRVAPAGKDSFHAVCIGDFQEAGTSVEYMMFSGLEWSAPLQLGFLRLSTVEWPALLKQVFFSEFSTVVSNQGESLNLVSAGNGRAFVTWPTVRGIVGRWVTWDAARTPTADKGEVLATWQPIKEEIKYEKQREEKGIHIKTHVVPRDAGLPRQTRLLITDLRKETGFQRTAAFSVSMGRIILDPTAPELVSTMIETKSDEILGRQGGSQPEEITCEIRVFEIATPATLLYWDVNTRIELLLRVRGQDREVSATATERTYIWPSEEMITRVVNEALRQAEEKSERALQELLVLPRGQE